MRVRTARRVLGGAANTAANLAALGARVALVSIVGDDEAGTTLTRCARDAGVDLYAVTTGMPTLRKTRVVGQHQQIVRLDYEELQPLKEAAVAAIAHHVEALVHQCDIVVMSDYAKGFFSEASARATIAAAHRAGRLVIVDPRPEHRAFYSGCDYITPNWREARGLLGLPDAEASPASVAAVQRELAATLGSNVVLTLGPGGISFCSRAGDEEFSMPTLAREVFDVSGAGDTVVATLALALVSGADHATALELANKAASVVVAKFGTATLTPQELLGEPDGTRLVPQRALQSLAATLRVKGKRIVAVTGSFASLQPSHVGMLNEARSRGDVLVIGLTRGSEAAAAEMLLALRCRRLRPRAERRRCARVSGAVETRCSHGRRLPRCSYRECLDRGDMTPSQFWHTFAVRRRKERLVTTWKLRFVLVLLAGVVLWGTRGYWIAATAESLVCKADISRRT